MSSTSIGTGTPQDDNENHPLPQDPWPSRTLGGDMHSVLEAASPKAATPTTDPADDLPLGEADVPAEVEDASTLPAVHVDTAQIDQAFPEGPNVAPSPWEQEAARGRS